LDVYSIHQMYFYFYHALLEQSKLQWPDTFLLYMVTDQNIVFLVSDSCRATVSISCTGSIWSVKFHWVDKLLLYTVTDKNIVFLVPDSCRTTIRICNRTNPLLHRGHHHNMIRMTLVSALFRQFGSCFVVFDIAG